MADTGVLEHDDDLQGGVLRLYQEDGVGNLVLAAPREGLPQQGVLAVYGEGKLLAKLYVTAANDGKLSLRVDDGTETPVQTAVLEAGNGSVAAGRLQLKVVDGRAVNETAVLEAGGEQGLRGRLQLTDAESQGQRIELGFAEDGPFLEMKSGQVSLRLSAARGLEWTRHAIPRPADPGPRLPPGGPLPGGQGR